MLKLPVLHPEILSALGSAGHLATILISEGNYPHNTKPKPRTKIVWSTFAPAAESAPTALEMVCNMLPIETAAVMAADKTGEYAMAEHPPIWTEFRRILATRS